MARNNKKEVYRLITPPYMDVTLNHFRSQDEAITEAKLRGAHNRTELFVKNTEGEWKMIYDSADDKEVEMKRLLNKESEEDWVDPADDTMLRKIMRRNPIEYFKRRVDGGMRLISVYITKDEDPLPFIRTILMSPDFVCWPLPSFATLEKIAIRRFEPCGNDATYLFKKVPQQTELQFT